ncbi:MAG: hypothetical protein ABH884_01105 [Candidatus Komeilibacteria bacterium]
MVIVKILGQAYYSHAEAQLLHPPLSNNNNCLIAKGTFKVFKPEKVIKQQAEEGDAFLFKLYVYKGCIKVIRGKVALFDTVAHGCYTYFALCRAGTVFFNTRVGVYLTVTTEGKLEESRLNPINEDTGGEEF